MSVLSIKQLLKNEKNKFDAGAKEVLSKRQSWESFADLTVSLFNTVVDEGNKIQLFDYLYVSDSRKDNQTNKMPNFIMLYWGEHPVGTSTLELNSQLAVEGSCTLTFSQSVFGDVICIMYPFKSELHKRNEEFFLLSSPHQPEWYTEKRILGFIKYFFSYSQTSSFIGKPDIIDRFRVGKLVIADKLKKANLSKAIGSLAKSILSVVKKLNAPA